MEKTKLLQMKEYNDKIKDLLEDLLLIKKNKRIKPINTTYESSVGDNLMNQYNKEGYKEEAPKISTYKIQEKIKEAEKSGNWGLVASLVGLLINTKAPPKKSGKEIKQPLQVEYTSTAGEHTDKYNKDVFNDATIENLTINEVLEEPPMKPNTAELQATKRKIRNKNLKPINQIYDSVIPKKEKSMVEYHEVLEGPKKSKVIQSVEPLKTSKKQENNDDFNKIKDFINNALTDNELTNDQLIKATKKIIKLQKEDSISFNDFLSYLSKYCKYTDQDIENFYNEFRSTKERKELNNK